MRVPMGVCQWICPIYSKNADFLQDGRRAAAVFFRAEQHKRGQAMAYKGLKVMDSDMHVMEPGSLWTRYIESEYREMAPASRPNPVHPRLGGIEMPGKQIMKPAGMKWFPGLMQHMEAQMPNYRF